MGCRPPGAPAPWRRQRVACSPLAGSRLCVIQSVLTNTARAHQNQAGAPSPSGGPAARAGSSGTRARSTTATSRPNVASAACIAAPAGWLSSIEASHSRRCAHLAACLRSSGCSSSLHASAVPAVGLVEEGAGGRYTSKKSRPIRSKGARCSLERALSTCNQKQQPEHAAAAAAAAAAASRNRAAQYPTATQRPAQLLT